MITGSKRIAARGALRSDSDMPDITKTYHFTQAIDKVYMAWVSDKTVIPPAAEMRVEPKVGGEYTIICKMGESDWVMKGIFSEVIPEQRLVYSWE
jgi:uncharacterized protein YndB with AHSA1/START domain|tara:strand:+ start:810 stop:1094 length:285 start_codon:yes stop_codon:yes gene_type:complete